jgi:hypothetical protein
MVSRADLGVFWKPSNKHLMKKVVHYSKQIGSFTLYRGTVIAIVLASSLFVPALIFDYAPIMDFLSWVTKDWTVWHMIGTILLFKLVLPIVTLSMWTSYSWKSYSEAV